MDNPLQAKRVSDVCTVCGNFGPLRRYYKRASWAALVSAAQSGCSTCEIFLTGVHTLGYPKGITAETKISIWTWGSADERLSTRLVVTNKVGKESKDEEVEFFRLADESCLAPLLPKARSFPQWSDSDGSFSLIQSWLKNCIESHHSCHQVKEERLPTRMLFVGTGQGDVKLVENCQSKKPYIALSHCWGDSPCIKTTKSTLSSRKLGIGWSVLPKTFQDAVLICHKLAVEFLWIDSLCILQDDIFDWERESSQMGEIYSQAILVVAASRSADSRGGCFSERETPLHTTFEIKTADNNVLELLVRKARTGHDGRRDPVLTQGQDPLLYRAWAFQERVLASRSIEYSHDDLIWECRTMTDSECCTVFHGMENIKMNFLSSLQGTGQIRQEAWEDLVSRYSDGQLSVTSDYLPAMSGIAKMFQSPSLGPYLAGIWQAHLPRGLLWRCCRPARRNDRAPSWSPASVEGRVEYTSFGLQYEQIRETHIQTTVLEARTILRGSDPTGAVAGGHLLLRGPSKPARLYTQLPSMSSIEPQLQVYIMTDDARLREFYPDSLLFGRPHEELLEGLPNRKDATLDGQYIDVICLRILTVRYADSEVEPRAAWTSRSLVLAPSLTVEGSYERLGLMVEDYDQPERHHLFVWKVWDQQEVSKWWENSIEMTLKVT